ncbi:MAG: MOSC domain-containing protein [Spirochaetaceae bacterium]|nr:MAG: MOSC domain-containing protein [Spirochaetaceae bacterium]
MTSCTIDAVLTGKPQPFGPNGELSAVRKREMNGPVTLGPLGLAGDEHVYHGHGGADKALLHYAAHHYTMWKQEFPWSHVGRGCFGENVSAAGPTEQTVCIGDRFRIGRQVVVEVSQPRQPCWKLAHNVAEQRIPRLMQERAATGWFYRVITPGPIAAGDRMELTERPLPQWSLSRVILGFYGTPLDTAFLSALTDLEPLGKELRTLARTRMETGAVEDWTHRLCLPLAHGNS